MEVAARRWPNGKPLPESQLRLGEYLIDYLNGELVVMTITGFGAEDVRCDCEGVTSYDVLSTEFDIAPASEEVKQYIESEMGKMVAFIKDSEGRRLIDGD